MVIGVFLSLPAEVISLPPSILARGVVMGNHVGGAWPDQMRQTVQFCLLPDLFGPCFPLSPILVTVACGPRPSLLKSLIWKVWREAQVCAGKALTGDADLEGAGGPEDGRAGPTTSQLGLTWVQCP